MANLIQIKRSLTTATPVSLANGELAYTANGDVLFVGSNGAVVPIGGKRVPGTLTANQALVANSTSGIDKIITSNAVITTLWANGSSGTSGQVLVSNGTAVFWGTGTSGSNTQVQFNDSGVANGTSGFTFDKTSNTLFVGNNVYTTTVNATTINAASHTVGTSTIANSSGVYTTGTVNGAVLSVGSSTIANSTGVYTGVVNGSSITVGNSSACTVANSTGVYTGIVNATSYNTGATGTGSGGFIANVTTVFIGNNTVNATLNTTGLNINAVTIANTTGVYTGVVNGSSLTVGSSTIANSSGVYTTGTVNGATISVGSVVVANSTTLNANGLIVNSTGAYVTGLVNATSYNAGATGTGAGGIVANSSTVFVGNNTVNTLLNSAGLNVNGSAVIANSSGVFTTGTTNAAILSVGSNFIANSTKVTFAGANIDATSATAALQNLNVSQNVTVVGNLTVNGNITQGDSTSDTINPVGRYANNLIPSANLTYNLGSSTLMWSQAYIGNTYGNTATYSGDVSIGGNLTVSGNVTTTNVDTVIVSDPMIYLAGNNYTSDLVDIGFAGNYYDGATQRHTGFVRHASDNTYYLFYNLTQELSNVSVVNTADPSFALSTLKAYLTSGGLTTNSTAVRITANSTINVQLTVNSISSGTLSLTTALPGNSGGTGLSSITNNAILVGNSTTGFNQLSLGASGYVLQSNGTALVYDILDGGSF